MAISKSDLLQGLKQDLKSAEILKREMDMKIAQWSNEYNGAPYGNEQKGKSSIVSRDIKKQSEWQHSSLLDPFVSSNNVIKCNPVTAEDTHAARQNELLLNAQFCRKFNRYQFMTKALKVLDREGTVIIQTGWDYEEEEVPVEVEVVRQLEDGTEVIIKEETTETVVKRNQPTAKVCRNEDVYLDPTCMDDMDKAQFVIYRYETDLSTLRQDGRYKNLDKIAMRDENTMDDYSYYPEDKTWFKFRDKARQKFVVYEYWGNYDVNEDGIAEPIVCTWVGDTIIRLQSNPYPDGKPPFIVVPFNSIPFQLHGEANAELIGDNQKVKTAIIRGVIDNMAQSNNGQVGMRKGALDPINRKRYLAGKNFEYNGNANDFWQGNYNSIPGSAFDMIGLMNNEIESITGVKSFSGGINASALGGTATGARGALDATSTRRLNIVRNISENLLKPLMRKWMSYNAEFLTDEEVVRVTNEQFVPVKRDDLEGKVDIDISISTAEDNAAKSQELSFLLQTLGNTVPFDITKSIMANILDLMRMPEQAKEMRSYQPQQDPMEEQMRQLQLQNLQLENAKLQSEISKNTSASQENEVDQRLKLAKAMVEENKARKLGSEADKLDLSFLKEDNNIDHMNKMELEELKYKLNLAQMQLQHQYGDTNIGVRRD